MPDTGATNRALVERFLSLVLRGESDAALSLVSPAHVEHSASMQAGYAGLAEFVRNVATLRDQMAVTIERVVADEQCVAVHLSTRWTNDRPQTVAVDLFRVENGLITEHWDVVQPVEAPPPSPHRSPE